MRVVVELVTARIAGDDVRYAIQRSEAPRRADPEATARAELAVAFPDLWLNTAIFHSTSWRYEDEAVVLTYLAFAEDLPTADLPLVLPLARVAELSHDVSSVAAHAIRHLAFLVHEQPRPFADRLRPETIARLRDVRPDVAGRLRLDAA
jgi:hypothetical protein